MNIGWEIRKIEIFIEKKEFLDEYKKYQYICFSVQEFYANHFKEISKNDLFARQQKLGHLLNNWGGVDSFSVGVIGGVMSTLLSVCFLNNDNEKNLLFILIDLNTKSIAALLNAFTLSPLPMCQKVFGVAVFLLQILMVTLMIPVLLIIYYKYIKVLLFKNAYMRSRVWKYELDLINDLLKEIDNIDFQYHQYEAEELKKRIDGSYVVDNGYYAQVKLRKWRDEKLKKLDLIPLGCQFVGFVTITFVFIFLISAATVF